LDLWETFKIQTIANCLPLCVAQDLFYFIILKNCSGGSGTQGMAQTAVNTLEESLAFFLTKLNTLFP
jgi:hypothetical protein